MGGLIDADEFEEFLWNNMDFMVPKGTEKLDQYEIKKLIDAQPTAYDVEKVVAELEDEKYEASSDDYFFDEVVLLTTAIDIVRGGGVE